MISNNSNRNYLILIDELNKDLEDSLLIRSLELKDYHKGYFELLSQLTAAEQPLYENWENRFLELERHNLTRIFVVECQNQKKVVATITCLNELKFIRNLGSICHIEDFVVDDSYRNRKLGSKLLDISIEFAKSIGCYKILLDSNDEVSGFYKKKGFKKTSNGMAIYF